MRIDKLVPSTGGHIKHSERINRVMTIQRITHFPLAGFEFSNNTRRSLTKRFPFGVIYQFSEEKNEIIILAIMQLNRNPNYWKHLTNE